MKKANSLILIFSALLTLASFSNENQIKNNILMNFTKISQKKAEKIALNEINGEIKESKLSICNNKLLYSFQIINKKEQIFFVEIDSNTGKIINKDCINNNEQDYNNEEDLDGLIGFLKQMFESPENYYEKSKKTKHLNKKISMEKAVEIVLKFSNGKLDKAEITKDKNNYKITIKLNNKLFSVIVNSYTGNIINIYKCFNRNQLKAVE